MDVGAELFAISATCVYARQRVRQTGDRSAYRVADVFCRGARRHIRQLFASVFRNDDGARYRLAQSILKGKHVWLENGPLAPGRPTGLAFPAAPELEGVEGAGVV